MRKLIMSGIAAIVIASAYATPSLAIIDSGDGCGCIRPCIPR